jgi:tetratricopeptide (TPR) repeat protein
LTSLVLVLLLAGDLGAAERALAEGRPREALDLLGDLADGPDADVRAYVVQGRAYLALGEAESAVEPLVRASDAKPGDKEFARDAAIACLRSAQGADARLYLEDARRLAGRSGEEALLADIEFALGEHEAALGRYRKLPGLHPKVRVAECLQALDQGEEARAGWGEALEMALEAGDLAAAYRAAVSAGRVGRFLAWLDERVAARPDEASYRLYRGFARSQSAMYPEAAEDLRFFLARSPRHTAAIDRLSFVLLQHGVRQQDRALLEESAELARATLDADPANREAWDRIVWLAGHAWANGDIERSYRLLKDLHARDPADTAAALNFCAMARRLARYDEARATYDALLEASPRDPDVLNDYGILLDGLGDRDGARKLWERALAEEPENLDALENLFTDAWERGDAAAETYAGRGLLAALARKGPVDRWLWFRDRLHWAPSGFGG